MDLVKCDGCNKFVKPQNGNDHLPDKGLIFSFQDSGYYGGFTDNVPWETESRMEPWKLCHDCVVKFLNTFPFLAELLGPGHHPISQEETKPCCAHSWTFDKDEQGELMTMYADGDGWKRARD